MIKMSSQARQQPFTLGLHQKNISFTLWAWLLEATFLSMAQNSTVKTQSSPNEISESLHGITLCHHQRLWCYDIFPNSLIPFLNKKWPAYVMIRNSNVVLAFRKTELRPSRQWGGEIVPSEISRCGIYKTGPNILSYEKYQGKQASTRYVSNIY